MGCISSSQSRKASQAMTLSPMSNSSPHLTTDEVLDAVKNKSFIEETQQVKETLADLADATKADFLYKRSKYKHNWARRYILLKGARMYSCHDASSNPNNVLQIDVNTQLVLPTEVASSSRTDNQHMLREKPHSFLVQDVHGQTWPLACEDQGETENWVTLIQEQIEDARLLSLYKATLLRTVQHGANFTKYNYDKFGKYSSGDKMRYVNVSADCKHLMWHKEGSGEFSELPVADIVEVVTGAATDVLKKAKVDEHRAFAVKARSRTLDLVASSKDERDTWIKGLTAVIKFGAVLSPEELDQLEEEKRLKIANMHAQEAVEGRKRDRSKLKSLINSSSSS